jgi:hypothetical protein
VGGISYHKFSGQPKFHIQPTIAELPAKSKCVEFV